MTAVAALTVSGPMAPWEAIGLRIDGGVARIGGLALRFLDDAGPAAVTSWTLVGSPDRSTSIDGLATVHLDDRDDDRDNAGGSPPAAHPLGATAFDHVVVMTSSIERTCAAIERVTGEPLKRIRDTGQVRQGFHRLGPMIVEVVESDRITADTASFWGFVLVVADLHEVAGRLGPDVLAPPKPAVQPGRFISSFRGAAGLGLPIALMTPHGRP